MKKLKYLIFSLILLIPGIVKADTIYDLSMNIYLNKDGSANITETWNVKADSGSEWYKQVYNMGNMKLSNYKVSMDGIPLTYKEWDINESLSEKKGYYGINEVSEGIELCFGKGDMERHRFTLTYTLSNIIFNTEDSQILYNTLFPNVTTDNFTVTVSSYYSFPDDLDVWGYGYKGYAYVKDGKIEMTNGEEGSLYDDYVVLLAKFPKETFDTYNSYEEFETFDDVLDMAEEGSYEYDYGTSNSVAEIIEMVLFGLFYVIMIGVPILIGLLTMNNGKYGFIGNKKITKKDTPTFREIPCNKNIYYANALIKLNNFGYKEANILGAIILKWVREDKIKFINEEKGIFNKNTSSIDLTKDVTFDNIKEQDLFNLMRAASGDGILEAKELEKWARKNYSKYLNIFKSICDNEVSRLKSEGHIYKRKYKEECKYKNVMDDTLYKDSKELYGLKLFLEEFSSINEKEVIEVKLWDEYLMFAYLFGIADKVAKQLKNLYPEVVKDLENQGIDIGTIYYINHISTSSVKAASAARAAAESYSGGGGGFSSGGGGGGSFGGGGGMGGR